MSAVASDAGMAPDHFTSMARLAAPAATGQLMPLKSIDTRHMGSECELSEQMLQDHTYLANLANTVNANGIRAIAAPALRKSELLTVNQPYTASAQHVHSL